MRVLFAGTPEFAAQALQALLTAGYDIPLVLTQPDRPAGRGQKSAYSPVKQLALASGLTVFQPTTLKDTGAQAALAQAHAQVMVVAAYGLILPAAVLALLPNACLNIHASLLPRWRGAAPIQRAIQAGDRETGICIMRMEQGLDTGPVLLRHAIPIEAHDTGGSLHDKLAVLGGQLIVQALQRVQAGTAIYHAQSEQGITYAHKIRKEEARVNWSWPADELERLIRAFNPTPVCDTRCGEDVLRVWHAQLSQVTCESGVPGQVLGSSEHGLDVRCGRGVIRITALQRSGGKRQQAGEFLRGYPIAPGTVLR